MNRLATLFVTVALTLTGPVLGGCETAAQSPQPSASPAQGLSDSLTARGYTAISLRRVPSGLDIVTLSINGVKGQFLLDTGASNSVIHSRLLARFNVSPRDLRNSDTAIGAGGRVAISSYNISGLTIKGRSFPFPEISATDLTSVIASFESSSGVRLDGIIGQDVMIWFDGIIDTKSQTLFLRRP